MNAPVQVPIRAMLREVEVRLDLWANAEERRSTVYHPPRFVFTNDDYNWRLHQPEDIKDEVTAIRDAMRRRRLVTAFGAAMGLTVFVILFAYWFFFPL